MVLIGFFDGWQRAGYRTTKSVLELAYNLAYNWKISPLEVKHLPLSELAELSVQTARIANELEQTRNG